MMRVGPPQYDDRSISLQRSSSQYQSIKLTPQITIINIHELQKQLHFTKQELMKKDQYIFHLRRQIDYLRTQIINQNNQFIKSEEINQNQAKKQRQNLQNQLHQLKKIYNNLKNRIQEEKKAQLKKFIGSENFYNEAIKEQIDSFKYEISSLKSKNQSLCGQISPLKINIFQLKGQNELLKGQINVLKKQKLQQFLKIQELSEKIKDFDETQHQLHTNQIWINQLSKQYNLLKQQVFKNQTKVGSIQCEKMYGNLIRQVQKNFISAQKAKKKIYNKYKNVKQKLDHLFRQQKHYKESIQAYTNAMKRYERLTQKQQTQLEEIISILSTDIPQVISQCKEESQNNQQNITNNKINELTNQNNSLKIQIKKLKKSEQQTKQLNERFFNSVEQFSICKQEHENNNNIYIKSLQYIDNKNDKVMNIIQQNNKNNNNNNQSSIIVQNKKIIEHQQQILYQSSQVDCITNKYDFEKLLQDQSKKINGNDHIKLIGFLPSRFCLNQK